MARIVRTGTPLSPAQEKKELEILQKKHRAIFSAINERNAYVRHLIEDHDVSYRALADAMGYSSTHIIEKMRSGELTINMKRLPGHEATNASRRTLDRASRAERNARIRELRKGGWTLRAIAEEVELSTEMVRQLVAGHK